MLKAPFHRSSDRDPLQRIPQEIADHPDRAGVRYLHEDRDIRHVLSQ